MGMTTGILDAMVTSDCGQYLLSVFSLLMIIECIISLELLELRVPTHVALGARAHLSCRWTLGPSDVLYSVKWYKDGKEFFRHVPRDSEPRRKFSLPGVTVEKSDSSGSKLVLSAVKTETAGRYRCEVSGERPLFPTVSKHADMNVIILPEKGQLITGLQTKYRLGDRVQVNCTSGPSRPACTLSWYINGEPAPTSAVLTSFRKEHKDELETTTLLLDFVLTEQHTTKNGIKVKCLATLASIYWRSNEESALLEKVKILERMVPNVQKTNSRIDRSHSNLACAYLTSCPLNLFGVLLVTLFVSLRITV